MILDFVNWTASPEIFTIPAFHVGPINIGPLSLRYYGLFFGLAFFVGYKIMEYVYKTEKLKVQEVDRLALHMIISIIVGARLGHVLFYEPELYLAHPIDILKIWEGGLASHGAAIGILIAMYMYTRKGPVRSYIWVLDRIIITVPIGGFFVRMGNLMNSEIYGKATTLPWGFRFHDKPGNELIPRHPSQIYEGIGYVLIFILLLNVYNRKHKQLRPGYLFGLFLILLFGLRFVVEFCKEVQVEWELEMISKIGMNQGQLLSIPFILVGIYLMVRSRKLKPEGPLGKHAVSPAENAEGHVESGEAIPE